MSKSRLAQPMNIVLLALMISLLPGSALISDAAAQTTDHVLFVSFSGYAGDGRNAYNMLVAAGADADYVLLNSNGKVSAAIEAAQLAGDPYDQIWFYDLSAGGDPYPTDYQAIADWFNGRPDPELICDGRFLSSYWYGRWNTEGRALAENYYVNFAARGGGLLLATDHNSFANRGANDVCDLIGINPFIGNFGGSFPVDPANALMTTPNDLTGGLYNDSSTGQAPFNRQPNGLILKTVGYHSGNTQNPGISSTIGGALNFTVSIDAPESGIQLCPADAVLATTSVKEQVDPVSYTWSSSIDGTLGTDQTQLLDYSTLSEGTHTITVLAEDGAGLFDDDKITIIVGGPDCGPTNQAPFADAGEDQTLDCAPSAGIEVTLDGSGSSDPDGDPLTYTWKEGVTELGTGVTLTRTLTPGVHTITLTVDDGTETATDEVIITVNAAENSLDVTMDVDTEYERTWNWDIDKEVFPETWDLFKGDQGTSKYTISVVKTGYTNSGWLATGTIYINNGGPCTPEIVSVTLKIDDISVATNCSQSLPYVIAVDGVLECTFSANLPDGSSRTAVVSVETSDLSGLSTATADVIFGDPAKTSNETIHVDDTNGSSWIFEDSGSKTYTKTFACDEHDGSHENTATIRETGQNASATVMVNCHELEIEKDSKTTFNRYYKWTIDKSAEDEVLNIKGCEEAKVMYKVAVDCTVVDKDYAVAGIIEVHNPAPIPAMLNSLKDVLPDAIDLQVDCGETFPYELAPDGTLKCGYSADMPDSNKRVNTAAVTLQNYSYARAPGQPVSKTPIGETPFSNTADVKFGDPESEIDECVNVYDTNLDPDLLGEVCVADAPVTFEYEKAFGPFYATDSYVFDNTAKFVTNDTQTEGKDSWRLTINVKCEAVKANFTANATKGISPFTVQFKDLSENAARWLWDFGDGTTSTEQHPEHIFYNPPRKHYDVTLTVWDCCEEYTDTMTKEDFITSIRPAKVNFNAHPIVGPPELQVQFINNSGGVITHWTWEYGDGMSDQFRSDVRATVDPMHTYPDQGTYSVSLTGWGQGGTDALAVDDLIYIDENYLALELLDGGATVDGEAWDDVIDHDIISPDANTTAINGDAWATFRFVDTTRTKLIHKVRLMTNNAAGSRFANHLVKDFEVMVSTDSVNFTSGFAGTIVSKYGWEIFEFEPVEAKYLKLVLVNARGEESPYITMGEFQVFGTDKPDSKELMAATQSDESSPVIQIPEEFGLSQNYPNPFNPETRIKYQLPDAADVKINIYNTRGQLVVSLVDDRMGAGYHEAVWRGTDQSGQLVGSGIYIYTYRAINDNGDNYSYTGKMTLLK